MTVEFQGETTKGEFTFDVSRNKKCFLLYHGHNDEPYTQQLQGYDPVSKKQIAFGFTGDGNFWIQTIGVDGMAKGKKAAKGVGGDWDHKIFSKDGKTTTRTCRWTWRQVEKNKIVMVWSDIKESGKVDLGARRRGNAEARRGAEVGHGASGADDALRRHASRVEAVAAQKVALDHRHPSAQHGRTRRADQTGRSSADDDVVVVRCGRR